MPVTFDFAGGPPSNAFATTVTDFAFTPFVDDGVTFTWSVTSAESAGYNYQPGNSLEFFLTHTVTGATAPNPGVTWTLDVQAPGGTNPTDGNFEGPISIEALFQSGAFNVTFHGTTPGMDVTRMFADGAGNQTVTAPAGTYTHVTFTSSDGGTGFRVGSLTTDSISCYCEGTRITTPSGFKHVEQLQAGDLVRTADGRDVPVEWVGTQRIDTRLNHPAKINPICISAGALGDLGPERDLWVSPDHAVEIDGFLINASALVNGTSIYRVRAMPKDGFTYYHVETQAHELLLAEGLAAESYLDMPSRDSFDNAAERIDAPSIREMDLPRISAARHLPQKVTERLEDAQTGRKAA